MRITQEARTYLEKWSSLLRPRASCRRLVTRHCFRPEKHVEETRLSPLGRRLADLGVDVETSRSRGGELTWAPTTYP